VDQDELMMTSKFGFALIELSIVLVIIGLIVGAFLLAAHASWMGRGWDRDEGAGEGRAPFPAFAA
jgi:prepilin-type N-terminal cleavage/methylation domain-containing protein